MNIKEIIKKRLSCRTFNQVLLDSAVKKELENYIGGIRELPGSEAISLIIVEKTTEGKQMKLNYGMIQGHNTYILGKSRSSSVSRVNYGYMMEKVVLKATELGISTCWIGYFDSTYFDEIPPGDGFEIPGIVILGYTGEKQTTLDKLIRFGVKASKRDNWDKLFFNFRLQTAVTPRIIKTYSDSLEMVRLAPSAGNTQPWRIYFDDTANEFHFFKKPVNKRYEERGLHDIDMGIALSHFELTSLDNGLSGSWIRHTETIISPIDDLQYIMTWVCK